MALLRDDELGLVMGLLHVLLPLLQRLLVLLRIVEVHVLRLALLQVVLVAVDEHDRVGVLLDRAGFAKIRKLRPLILPVLDLAGELGERDDGNGQFLRDRLQALGDLADLLHTVLRPRAGGGPHQLQVVDDDKIQPLGPLQPSAARPQGRDGDGRRIVDEQRQRLKLPAHFHETVEILLPDLAAADPVTRDPRLLREQTGGELVRAHFQREDRNAPAGYRIRVGLPRFSQDGAGSAEPDLGRKRRLTHGRTAGQDHQVRVVQAAQLGIQVTQPGRQAGDAARRVEGALGMVHGRRQRALEGDEAAARLACLGEVEQLLLRGLELLLAIQLRLRPEGAVHQRLTHIHKLPAQPAIMDDAAILAGIDHADHGGDELAEIGGAAHLIQQAGMLELRAQGHRIGKLARLDPALDRGEDAGVDGVREMVGRQELADALIGLVVRQQRAEQRLLRLEVGGRKPLGEAEKPLSARRWREGVHGDSLACPGALGCPLCLWVAVDSGDGCPRPPRASAPPG